ncbi:disease resistance protein RPS5-like [Brassica napus]|uniref:disease resistance protein RPS5-like n=1 Tax=Brassica napus TaxID=3708 RepID=UPI002078729E|nr:disease resistance protein RPS5-like [Brassica napus]
MWLLLYSSSICFVICTSYPIDFSFKSPIRLGGSTMSGFVTSVLHQAFTHLCSCFGVEVNYVWNLEKNLAALEDTMKVLRARRADVLTKVQRQECEGLQRLNEVEVWLTSVEDIQNQVYELLLPSRDELERLSLCTKNLSSSHSYGKRVLEMLKEVEDVQSKGVFGVVAGPPTNARAEEVEMPLPPTIVGQEKMLEKAWKHLMDTGTEVMGLYGMGGVLERINIKFLEHPVDGVDIVIFVVVSNELRVEIIQDVIAENLGFRGEEWSRKTKREKALVLHTSLKKMRFVLLLDDIWKEVDLNEIGVPFPTRANGCKVVFTTRFREVCGQMGVDDPMEVKCLESKEAWDLFRAKVGKITLESHPDILELACQVAGKCRGLPLALNIIGENMASKRTVEEWEQAVDTLASSAADFPGMEDHILPVLKYSYDSLKGEHVKSCFLYCALFPEDFAIEKEKLIDYWICEGFIDEKQGLNKAKNQGYGIIGTLVQACLLTEEEECESHVRMHDVVREMALWIASDFGKDKDKCIVKAGARLRQVPTVENWRSVRRMSLMDNKIENISESPTCPELTTLLFQKNNILNISGEFFKYIPKLVVLDLSHNKLFDGFPEEISKLVSLRYLDLSCNRGIQRLFRGLLELKELIYLNMEGTGLTSISGISNLSSLRTLRLRYNKMSRDSNVIEELQLLKHLEVVTIEIGSILVAEQLVNGYRVANAIQVISIHSLEEKSILTLPDMPLVSTLDMFRSEMVEIHIKRRTSSLNKSPTTPSFPDLSTVNLRDCHGLKDLTWLLFAPNLRALELDSLNQVEDIIIKEKAADILTEEEAGTIIPFQKLEFFQVYGLPKLKSIYWSPLPFPRLREFNIYNSPNLRKLPLDSRSGSSIELAIHNGEQYYRDKVEWEDEATKERFLRCINPSLY